MSATVRSGLQSIHFGEVTEVVMNSLAVLSIVALIGLAVECVAGVTGVEAVGFYQKTIYHSPETPGYTSWCGLWQLPNGRLRCDFLQLTGPFENPVTVLPVLESRDEGKTWTHVKDVPTQVILKGGIVQSLKDTGRGMAVLPDGVMIRPAQPPLFDGNVSGWAERSADGRKWEKIYPASPQKYRVYPTVIRPLRDGRVVLFAGCWKVGDYSNGKTSVENLTKCIFVSSDKGRTWGRPVIVMPLSVGACEESDFCELPNGDLFFVHRAVHYGKEPLQTRMQSVVHRRGEDFVPGPCEPAALPHSGFPMVLYAKEGVILHLATDGVNWTNDLGKTWTRLDIPGTPYYPKALQLKDGKIVLVGHNGWDDVYGTVDQSIIYQEFRLKITK